MYRVLCYAARAARWNRQLHVTSTRYAEKNFEQLGLNADLCKALLDMGITAPTPVQESVIPAILSGKDVIFAAQTGTGKTLAYLTPIVQRIKDDEANGVVCRENRPRALIVVPTRELCFQVLSVAKQLSHIVKFRSMGVTGGARMSPQSKALDLAQDLYVATPGRLLQHREKGRFYFTDLRYVIVDEADTLFAGDFADAMKQLILPVKNNPRLRPQFICASATIPERTLTFMQKIFPDAKTLFTKSTHANPKNITQTFVRVATMDKYGPLLQAINENPDLPTLVFCNTIASCRAADHYLREKGVFAVCFHGGIPPDTRADHWKQFQQGAAKIAVVTDAAARGLDTTMIEHVMMVDFPSTPIDYLHRIGRTGRLGKPGKATSFIQRRDVPLAKAIQIATRAGKPIDGLTSNKALNEEILGVVLDEDMSEARPTAVRKVLRERGRARTARAGSAVRHGASSSTTRKGKSAAASPAATTARERSNDAAPSKLAKQRRRQRGKQSAPAGKKRSGSAPAAPLRVKGGSIVPKENKRRPAPNVSPAKMAMKLSKTLAPKSH
eukprot:TRINITY_DN7311_c0_g2_i1.p1 TRINITY_DN7311_c0_g2~~TRINITY_DN7311_c0_g2_i1.p1  ORF type:complete len:555 (+),score=144.84 TRINITY_DN7311_c0_g2_i1:2-1666(+)